MDVSPGPAWGRDEAALRDVLSPADQRRLWDLLRTLVLTVEEPLV